jgi:hypothetical protein
LRTSSDLRQAALHGPKFRPEEDRLGKIQALPEASRLEEFKKILDEYHAWWNTHQNDPVYLPPK